MRLSIQNLGVVQVNQNSGIYENGKCNGHAKKMEIAHVFEQLCVGMYSSVPTISLLA